MESSVTKGLEAFEPEGPWAGRQNSGFKNFELEIYDATHATMCCLKIILLSHYIDVIMLINFILFFFFFFLREEGLNNGSSNGRLIS